MSSKGKTTAVVWKNNLAKDLGGCCGGAAVGLNNRGQVIGNIYDAQGHYQAFLWDETSGLQHIGPPNAFSSALAIKDAGRVLVESFSHVILLYDHGKLTQLSLSPKHRSQPRALTNSDVIVGSFGPFADADHAFYWDEKGGFRDLNDLIPSGSGWELRAASGINGRGEIVGWGDLNGEEGVGFLLAPKQ